MAFLSGLRMFLADISGELVSELTSESVSGELVSGEGFVAKASKFFSNISTSINEFFDVFFANYVGWFMVALAVIAVINAVFAFKCADIASKRGYDEDKYFTLGFIFGVFTFIRVKCLKDRLNKR